jgi:hypothetical protein
MTKVCNKPPSELKIDQIDSNFDKLLSHVDYIIKQEQKSADLKIQIEGIRRKYLEFEKHLKD